MIQTFTLHMSPPSMDLNEYTGIIKPTLDTIYKNSNHIQNYDGYI